MTLARTLSLTLLAAAVAGACSKSTPAAGAAADPAVAQAAQAISADSLLQHIKDLSDDSTEGRAPGTPGEAKATAYMQRQFAALGLKPGNPDGSWYQPVELIGYTAHPTATIVAGGKTVAMKYPDDYVAASRHARPETKVDNSDVVFVGYGVVAPEYGWDDYKGVDVRGKTLLMLINDPQVRRPNDPSKLDAKMFKGKAMTYYGRWTYKYEIAAAKGAAGAIDHPSRRDRPGIPGRWCRAATPASSSACCRPDEGQRAAGGGVDDHRQGQGAVRGRRARLRFALRRGAVTKAFKPVTLKAKASWTSQTTVRHIDVAQRDRQARGQSIQARDQYVIYTAHWDHLGVGARQRRQIYHGAAGQRLGVRRAARDRAGFHQARQADAERSIFFLSVTAEEKGLLGSQYYAEHPLYPLKNTLADINMDGST